ncbi:MAG: hypothetical protein JW749_07115, partial [Sedimentisphaerales bacterium]|nr:hypothetical protein [Sedimentisphaerales bacterium]
NMKGVIITGVEVGSQSDTKGLRPGVLIMEVNRKTIENVREFNKAMEEAASTGKALLSVNDGNRVGLVILNLSKE